MFDITDHVRTAAAGQWADILPSVAGIDPVYLDGKHHPCPRCNDGTDRFRFINAGACYCNVCFNKQNGDGFAAVMWMTGCSFKEAVNKVGNHLGVIQPANGSASKPHSQKRTNGNGVYEQIWIEAKSDNGRIAKYFVSRGLPPDVPDCLRLHSELTYKFDDARRGQFPGIVAAVVGADGKRQAIHRTFLDGNGSPGKANVPEAKKALGPIGGGAVHLAEPAGETIALTEGIETGLAVQHATGTPTWATITAGGLSQITLPAAIKYVEIWADNDANRTGIEKAEKAADRFHNEGREVFILLPSTEGDDWLDVLNRDGVDVIKDAQASVKQWLPSGAPEKPKQSFDLGIISSAEFAGMTFPRSFLVKDVLVEGQPCIMGGRQKVLKTSQLVDLAISLGTNTCFLGEFETTRRCNVLMISGESGGATLQETAKRIATSKGLLLSNTSVSWGFKLPQFAIPDHMAMVESEIKDRSIDVAIFDPTYLAMITSEAQGRQTSNLFDMGSLLFGLSRITDHTGATIILAHHCRKGPNDYEPPELQDLAFAGFAEWARQWLLIGRRAQYESGTGFHELWLTAGGSAGHCG